MVKINGREVFDRAARKAALRKYLNAPLRLKGIAIEDREQAMADDVRKRFDAAFELFDIPADAPDDAKNAALAWYLMPEAFRGCRAMLRQPGGAPKVGEEKYAKLARSWRRFLRTCPAGSKTARAKWFLQKKPKQRVKLGHETISNPKSLLRAIRRGEANLEKVAL